MIDLNSTAIECGHCKSKFSNTDIQYELLIHGFFVLSAPDDELIFTNCPNKICHAPLLIRKGAEGTIDTFFEEIVYFHTISGGMFQVDFKNHSSLHMNVSGPLALLLPQADIQEYRSENSDSFRDELYYFENNNQWLKNYYCSIHHNFLEPISDVPISIWWFNKKQIKQLLDIEKKHKLRIFPRYMPVDPIVNEVDQFVWKYHLTKIFYKSLPNFPFPILTANNAKNHITKNYLFINLIEALPRLLQSAENVVAINGSHSLSNKMVKVFEEFKLFHFDKIKETIFDLDDIWDGFHEKPFQDNISILADNFIADYSKMYSNIDFGLPAIWKLLLKYCEDAISSLPKKKFRNKIFESNRAIKVKKIQTDFPEFNNIISNDFSLSRIKEELGQILKYNEQPMTLLLLGEQGTGKELFARAIHETHKASGRTGEYLHVNCTSIQENLFESELFGYKKGAFSGADRDQVGLLEHVNNGTLFLDEIGGLSPKLQLKLLTAVENRYFLPVGSREQVNVNVTLIFATNKNLIKEVENGTFLDDLYSRIKRFSYKIPPLRERKGDIEILVKYFIKKHTIKYKKESLQTLNISEEGIKVLNSLKWAGNVRDLEGLFEKIIVLRAPDDLQEITSEEIKFRAPEDILIQIDGSGKNFIKRKNKEMPSLEKYAELREQGMTISAIAAEYGYRREHLSKTIEKKYKAIKDA